MPLLPALLACASPETSPALHEDVSGTCPSLVGATEVEHDVLAATDHHYFTDAIAFLPSKVIRNDTGWDELVTGLGITLPAPDFTNKMALAAWYVGDTCDAVFDGHGLFDVDGTIHLEARFSDGSECGSCDAPGGGLVIVVTEAHDQDPTICRRVVDLCP